VNNDGRHCDFLDKVGGESPGKPYDVFLGRSYPNKKLIDNYIRNPWDMENQEDVLIEGFYEEEYELDPDLCELGLSYLRIAHLHSHAQKIDIFMDGTPLYLGLKYKNLTCRIRVRPGTHRFVIFQSGQVRPLLSKALSIPNRSIVYLLFFGSRSKPDLMYLKDRPRITSARHGTKLAYLFPKTH